jgi:hypothetical protein
MTVMAVPSPPTRARGTNPYGPARQTSAQCNGPDTWIGQRLFLGPFGAIHIYALVDKICTA